MVSLKTSQRPTAKEILWNPNFDKFHWEAEAKSPHAAGNLIKAEAHRAMVMIGENGKLREMYIRIMGGKLFGYKTMESEKARFSYPLAECKIELRQVSAFLGGEEPIIQERKNEDELEIFEGLDANEEMDKETPVISHDDVLEIRHPELETIYVMINVELVPMITNFDA